MKTKGKLYICPTPIGNLEDITLRVARILSEVDVIAAEDTRHTLKLLNHLGVSKRLVSYHEHNKERSGDKIIEMLNEGKNVALVSDAGMPGISDPGSDIIRSLIDENMEFEVLPGPVAFINALIGSGLDTSSFVFQGFIDRSKKERRLKLEDIGREGRTQILYEAPHRLLRTLKELYDVIGDRPIVICRELTKRYEEFFRTTVLGGIKRCEEDGIKGEIVLVISPPDAPSQMSSGNETIECDYGKYEEMIKGGESSKDMVKLIKSDMGISKNDAYAIYLEIKENIQK